MSHVIFHSSSSKKKGSAAFVFDPVISFFFFTFFNNTSETLAGCVEAAIYEVFEGHVHFQPMSLRARKNYFAKFSANF